jgi:hypothetical protein
MIRTLPLVLLLGGCALFEREPVSTPTPTVVFKPEIYTRPEIDAINAEAQCMALAKTMVQVRRCEIGRR